VTLCLVTDRRRLVRPDASEQAAVRCLLTQVRHAVEAGVEMIQVRERDLDAGPLSALVREMLAATRGTPTRVIVNDRLDVAIACGAHGVHLRGTSLPAAAVRRLAPRPFVVGRSVHGVADLDSLDDVDYLVAGTVFPSASKPDGDRRLGIDGLRDVVGAAACPVLAIGGVTLERLGDVAATGASGVAAIGLFMADGAVAGSCRARPLRDLVAHARQRFDTVVPPS
jgi:thiamine-phosphate pyrophosphorylase